jgi:hypothetical protein
MRKSKPRKDNSIVAVTDGDQVIGIVTTESTLEKYKKRIRKKERVS